MNYDWFPNLGAKIGSGVDGEVYEIKGTNEVVKFSPTYDLNLLTEIMSGFHPHFVAVHDFGKHEDVCFVVMERLLPISDDEERLFHSLVSHEDRGITKPILSPEELEAVLDELVIGLRFKRSKVREFYQRIVLGKLTHKDLHPRNIMVDADGNFKLIDLDRIQPIGDTK
jgi:serine/threonine protein kinase